jgi:hypothetical protein
VTDLITYTAIVGIILDICTFPAALNAAGILASCVLYTIFTRLTGCVGLASIGIVAIAVVIGTVAYARSFIANLISVASIANCSAIGGTGGQICALIVAANFPTNAIRIFDALYASSIASVADRIRRIGTIRV